MVSVPPGPGTNRSAVPSSRPGITKLSTVMGCCLPWSWSVLYAVVRGAPGRSRSGISAVRGRQASVTPRERAGAERPRVVRSVGEGDAGQVQRGVEIHGVESCAATDPQGIGCEALFGQPNRECDQELQRLRALGHDHGGRYGAVGVHVLRADLELFA